MDVALMTYVHDKAVSRRIEDTMQSNGQFDHAEVRSEMAAGLREDLDQLIAYFLRESRQILFTKRFDVRWRTDSIEQTFRRACHLFAFRTFRRV
jgi:hypothetical protein